MASNQALNFEFYSGSQTMVSISALKCAHRRNSPTCFNLDIDECATNTHSCQPICINTPGTYKCGCRRGYELQANGRNCAG